MSPLYCNLPPTSPDFLFLLTTIPWSPFREKKHIEIKNWRFWICKLYESPRAAVTNDHKVHGLDNRHLFSHKFGDQRSAIKMTSVLIPSGVHASLLAFSDDQQSLSFLGFTLITGFHFHLATWLSSPCVSMCSHGYLLARMPAVLD